MERLRTGSGGALVAMLCAVLFVFVWAGSVRAGEVTDIRIGQHGEMTRFVVEVKGKIDYRVFTLPDPYRVVLDLSELTFPDGQANVASRGGVVERYRFGLFQPGISRVVLDLDRAAIIHKHFVLPARGGQGARLVIDMKPVSRTVFMDRMERPAPLASAARPENSVRAQSASGKRVVVIDPGHGGVDPGAISSATKVHEKDITLAMARVVRDVLERTGRYEVVLTRDRDIFIPLRQRFEIARNAEADLFISLHADSFRTAKVRGASVYTLSERASDREAELLAAKENKSDLIAGINLSSEPTEVSSILIDLARRESMNYSAHFAGVLVNEMGKSVPMLRNSHRFAGFVVLKAPDVPSVLVEMGYLSNPDDAQFLASQPGRVRMAESIRRAIDGYFVKIASGQGNIL
ncbi:MAG: N-acetylmuramoyl-L-alanine amidase [Sphingomonadales bacterium]